MPGWGEPRTTVVEVSAADVAELAWWRHFAVKQDFGSQLPRVGVPLVGHGYFVIRDDHELYDVVRGLNLPES